MNVYDFDGTIYSGDSTIDFYIFCLKKKPGIVRVLGKQLGGAFQYKMGKLSKTQFKEAFFAFLPYLQEREKMVNEFWKANEKKIKPWYWENRKEEDIIISASPEFLLSCMKKKLGIQDVIASKVDINTGKFLGENCRGEEKIKRFSVKYKIESIDNFYSDSDADIPMARIAKKAYKVRGLQVEEWEINKA